MTSMVTWRHRIRQSRVRHKLSDRRNHDVSSKNFLRALAIGVEVRASH